MTFTQTDPQGHKGKTDIWLTPKWILEGLGHFDLDPCAHPGWETAGNHFYKNGLERAWGGRIWLNPPYSQVKEWLGKLEDHGNGMALIFARTDTAWFQSLRFDGVNFLKGRIKFLNYEMIAKTNAGSPSCLLAFGKGNLKWLHAHQGKVFLSSARKA